MKIKIKEISAIILASSLSFTVCASSSHYVPGIEGVKGSALPPPGVYYKGYALNYTADENDTLPADSKVTVNAIAHRVTWVTEKKALDGDLAFEAILPMLSTDIKIADKRIDKQTGIGDLYLGGIIGWHSEQWDVTAGAGYWGDIGQYDKNEPASPGKSHDSFMLSLGSNLRLNQAGDVTFSILGRYEMPNDSKLHDELILEWGLGKSYGLLDVGLVGYNTAETGSGKLERNALGLSAGYFWPTMKLGANIAAYKEFSNEDTFEGNTIRAVLIKAF